MNLANSKTIIIIVIIAAFLRFWQLGNNPPSLTWDEAAWGYNAYSLGIDGRDEHGRFLPLDYLESFGDFKPPLYAYLDIIPVKLFGLNEFAVRFPSAFFGVLTVLATYFLVREIFRRWEVRNEKLDKEVGSEKKSSHLSLQNQASHIALLTSFILAISPWHINLSRAAFEANVATFFIVLGVFLFLKATVNASRSLASFTILLISIASFVLSMYTFNTARVVVPLLLTVLLIGKIKILYKMKISLITALAIGFILFFPLVLFLKTPQSQLRFKEVNIFSDIGVIERTNQQMLNDRDTLLTRILHNRRFAYTVEYLKHYFDHFKSSFLFINGDGNPKFSTQDIGSLYLWDLPFFVLGILFIFRQRIGYWWFIPLWMIIGVAPAATARETPHVLRIESTLPTFQIFTAYGVFVFITTISKIKCQISKIQIKYLIFALSILFLIFNFSYYLHGYYMHYPREYSGEWQYGYKESIEFVKKQEQNFDEVKITTELGRPYIYYLFYTKTNPEKFRKTAKIEREVFGFVNVEKLGKYSFAKDLNPMANKSKKILYVDIKNKAPDNAKILQTFYLLNGNPALVAYEI